MTSNIDQTQQSAQTPPGISPAAALVWGLLGIVLVTNVPLFLSQHLTSDAVLYDLQAKCVLSGGILYRDIVEPNFPGVVWLHLLVRTLFGWSWQALRAFDLAMLCGILVLLTRWIARPEEPRRGLRTALLWLCGFAFYLSQSEWCHCQRDLWMLLPALAAMHLRASSVMGLQSTTAFDPGKPRAFLSILEGIFWGMAFWIKPHIAVPALAVLAVSCCFTGLNRRVVFDWTGILCGGLLIGGAGSLWMIQSGVWPHFWEMQLHWNAEYLQAGRAKLSFARFWGFFESFAPWSLVSVASLIVSGVMLSAIMRRCLPRCEKPQKAEILPKFDRATIRTVLLCSLYCGWVFQILVIQYPMAYVWMPAVILALAIAGSMKVALLWENVCWALGTALAMLVVLHSPLFELHRLEMWGECVQGRVTPDVRSHLQVEFQPDWHDLGPVIDYLKTLDLKPGELNAYSTGLVHLYPEFDLAPPTRYVYVNVLALIFKSHSVEIEQALQSSTQKYVVTSLREARLPEEEIERVSRGECRLEDCVDADRLRQFPFNQTLIFQSGQYLVHRVDFPVAPICTDSSPLEHRRTTQSVSVPPLSGLQQ